jgi:hypothetical protein
LLITISQKSHAFVTSDFFELFSRRLGPVEGFELFIGSECVFVTQCYRDKASFCRAAAAAAAAAEAEEEEEEEEEE